MQGSDILIGYFHFFNSCTNSVSQVRPLGKAGAIAKGRRCENSEWYIRFPRKAYPFAYAITFLPPGMFGGMDFCTTAVFHLTYYLCLTLNTLFYSPFSARRQKCNSPGDIRMGKTTFVMRQSYSMARNFWAKARYQLHLHSIHKNARFSYILIGRMIFFGNNISNNIAVYPTSLSFWNEVHRRRGQRQRSEESLVWTWHETSATSILFPFWSAT